MLPSERKIVHLALADSPFVQHGIRRRRTRTPGGRLTQVRDTIAAIATPPGRGAIAIVRVSGEEARNRRARLSQRVRCCTPRRDARRDPRRGRRAGRPRAGAAVSAPHSYTGEDVLELHVHGTPVVARETLAALLAAGARLAARRVHPARVPERQARSLGGRGGRRPDRGRESQPAARAAHAHLAGGLRAASRDAARRPRGNARRAGGAIDFPDEVPEPPRERLRAELATHLQSSQGCHAAGSAAGWCARASRRDRRPAERREILAAERAARRRTRPRLGRLPERRAT